MFPVKISVFMIISVFVKRFVVWVSGSGRSWFEQVNIVVFNLV